MKRYLYCISVLSLLIFSCKKDKKTNTVDNKTPVAVTFNVSGFSQSTEVFTSGSQKIQSTNLITNALTDNIESILYAVYDVNGKPVKTINQYKTQSGFGTINDNLIPGDYTFVFIGYKNDLGADGNGSGTIGYNDANMSGTGVNQITFNNANISFYNDPRSYKAVPFKDTFAKKVSLTVTTQNSPQAVVLDRITSQLQINIEDALPADAKTLHVDIDTEYYAFKFSSFMPISNFQGKSFNIAIPSGSAGQSNFNTTTYLLNNVAPFSVTIQCLDASNKIIASKVISNVTCVRNKKTILTGKLFSRSAGSGSAGTNGFTIQIDPTWAPPGATISF